MEITILAFARLAELVGARRAISMEAGATVRDVWELLAGESAEVAALRASTRTARNGRIVAEHEPLADGDELALLPPVGGG